MGKSTKDKFSELFHIVEVGTVSIKGIFFDYLDCPIPFFMKTPVACSWGEGRGERVKRRGNCQLQFPIPPEGNSWDLFLGLVRSVLLHCILDCVRVSCFLGLNCFGLIFFVCYCALSSSRGILTVDFSVTLIMYEIMHSHPLFWWC